MKTKIDHINMSVTNLEESIQWYKSLFGFEKVEDGVTAQGRKFAIIALNDNMLAMYESPEKEKANPVFSEPKHQIFHFGLRVDDLNEWLGKIREFGVKINYGDVVEYPNSKSWYVFDPSGHEVEVSWTEGGVLRF